MKKRNVLLFVFGLFLSMVLVMPVYAEDLNLPASVSFDDADAQPLDAQTLKQQQEEMIQDFFPAAFGEAPDSWTVTNVDAWSLEPWDYDGILGGSAYGGVNGRWWYAGNVAHFFGPIESIPTGASVFGMWMGTCDYVNDGQIIMRFQSNAYNGGSFTHRALSTGITATPGCKFTATNIDPQVQINNSSLSGRNYRIQVEFTKKSSALHFNFGGLLWYRVISPAPATATFIDVAPGRWSFPYVEALAASGITKGCAEGGGRFCPEKVVTREQMAAFLARALGLHWPG